MTENNDTAGMSLRDLVAIFIRKSELILAIVVVAVFGSLFFNRIRPKNYTASATIVVESIANLTTWSNSKVSGTVFPNELSFLTNRETIQTALDAMSKDSKNTLSRGQEENLINALRGSIDVERQSGTNLTIVTFSHPNRDLSIDFLNSLLKSFSDALQEYASSLLEKEYISQKEVLTVLSEQSVALGKAVIALANEQQQKDGDVVNATVLGLLDNRFFASIEPHLFEPELYGALLQYSKAMSAVADAKLKLSPLESYIDEIRTPVKIIENPRVKDNEKGNNDLVAVAVGLILGLLIGFSVVVIIEYQSKTINSLRDIRKIVGSNPLVHILTSSSSKTKSFLIKTKRATLEPIMNLSSILACSGKKVITVTALDFGESSAFTVLKLASQISEQGKKVLVIGTMYEEAIYTVLSEKISPIKMIKFGETEKAEALEKKHLFTLCVFDDTYENSKVFDFNRLKAYVEESVNDYDLVLIHGPSFRTPSALLNVISISDQFILVIRECVSSRKRLAELCELFTQCGVPIDSIGLIKQMRCPRKKELQQIRYLTENMAVKDKIAEEISINLF